MRGLLGVIGLLMVVVVVALGAKRSLESQVKAMPVSPTPSLKSVQAEVDAAMAAASRRASAPE